MWVRNNRQTDQSITGPWHKHWHPFMYGGVCGLTSGSKTRDLDLFDKCPRVRSARSILFIPQVEKLVMPDVGTELPLVGSVGSWGYDIKHGGIPGLSIQGCWSVDKYMFFTNHRCHVHDLY